ncbi:MAG: phosphotransferase [Gemmatimonadetes bacterium]|nr:phosphotransferase [Gemmatimonadota bacterium]
MAEGSVAREVALALPRGQSVDALIVLKDARVSIATAISRLRPDGILYWEIDRRSPGWLTASPGRSRRYLRRVGLAPTATYWVKPDFERCAMLLPLEERAALAWYFRTLYGARTAGRRLARSAVARGTGLDPHRFERLVPCYAVIACRTGESRNQAFLLDQARLSMDLRKAGSRPLILTGGEGEWSRVTMLPFIGDDPLPALVIKMPRVSVFNACTSHEQSVLVEIRRLLGSVLLETIPEPRGTFEWKGLLGSAESYMDGPSLGRESSRWPRSAGQAIENLRLAAGWLAEFHSRTRVGSKPWSSPAAGGSLARMIRAYISAFGESPAEETLFRQLSGQSAALGEIPLPLVWQHRDFAPENVRRRGSRVGVIDWEVAQIGLPLCDLIYFVLHWDWTVHGTGSARARRERFCKLFLVEKAEEAHVSAARREIAAYMGRLEVDPRLLPLLLAYTLVEQAVDRADRRRRIGDPLASFRGDNPYVGLVDALASEGQAFLERVPV